MPNLDTAFLNNVTRSKFLKVTKNQIYNKTVLLNRFMSAGRVKEMTGTSLQWPVIAKKHTPVGVYSGYDTLASQPVNPTAVATLNTANYYATLAISVEEEKKNSGSIEKLLDMVKIQFDNAMSTLKDRMATDLYNDGTLVSGRYVIYGLKAAVSSSNTYANINRATSGNEYWQANVNSSAHTLANMKDSTSTSYLPSLMRTAQTSATHDASPDLIVTTKTIYNIYQDIAQVGSLRFNNEVANLGFGGVEFGPGVTMVFDDYCTAYYMYFLTTADWSVFVLPGLNFDDDEEGWRKPIDQNAKLNHIYWSGQLRLDAPWQQYQFQSLAAS
jgi:hypothetical protein